MHKRTSSPVPLPREPRQQTYAYVYPKSRSGIISYGHVEGDPIILPETGSRPIVKSLEVKIVFPKVLADNLGHVRRAVVGNSLEASWIPRMGVGTILV